MPVLRTLPHGLVRLGICVTTLAAVLAPAWPATARTISVPSTLAESVRLQGDQGAVDLTFAATHIGFSWTGTEKSGIRYRVLMPTGVETRWRRAPESHDLEHGDRHHSGVLRIPRALSVQWATTGNAHAVVLDYLNTLDGPKRTIVLPDVASAAASTPRIVTRAEWGADESIKRTTGGCTRRFFRVQQLFVHHTAGSNFDPNPRATMRAIYWYHTVRRGWCDIGYNFVIGANGTVFEARWARKYAPFEVHDSETRSGLAVAGAHVSGYNSGSVGISLMGNFTSVDPTPEARRSLAEVLAWEADRHNLDPMGRHTYRNPDTGRTRRLPYIAGHRDAGATSCPGDRLYRSLDEVRRDTAAAIGPGKPTSSLTMEPSTRTASYGDTVPLSGTLTDESDAPLAARTIDIYRLDPEGTWALAGKVTTGLDGTYSFTAEPKRTVSFVAVYQGDNATWGSSSEMKRVAVRPDITIAPEGGTPDDSGQPHYPPGTTSVPVSGTVTPAHPGGSVMVLVHRVEADGRLTLLVKTNLRLDRSSSYRYNFPVPGPATYRAVARFNQDRDHARAWSQPATFVVD